MPVNLHTTHYRFGVDELAENTHGWHANEDANPAQGVIAVDTTFLLRFTVQETGATAAANVDNQFQVSRNGGAFQNITTSSTIVKAVAAAALTDAGNCTKRLSGTGTFESTGAGQTEDGLSGGNANDIAASGNSETECGLQIVSGDVVNGDVLTFRLTSPDFTVTNDVVPTLTVAASVSATPTVGALSLTGAAATRMTDSRLTPPAGTLDLAGVVPTVEVSTPNVTRTPGVGALALSGASPVVIMDARLAPAGAALAMTGAAPAVTEAVYRQPSPGALALAGQQSAVRADTALTPGTGALATTGSAPGRVVDRRFTPAAAVVGLEGGQPTVEAIGAIQTQISSPSRGRPLRRARSWKKVDLEIGPETLRAPDLVPPPFVLEPAPIMSVADLTALLRHIRDLPVEDPPSEPVVIVPDEDEERRRREMIAARTARIIEDEDEALLVGSWR